MVAASITSGPDWIGKSHTHLDVVARIKRLPALDRAAVDRVKVSGLACLRLATREGERLRLRPLILSKSSHPKTPASSMSKFHLEASRFQGN